MPQRLSWSVMPQVLTLIAKPLTDDHVRLALGALPSDTGVDWLAEAEACDLKFDGPAAEYERMARDALDGAAVDLYCQPDGAGRRRKLLVADMDSTMITTECIDEMADMLGQKDRVAAITVQAMAGELSFDEALRERAAMLIGLHESDLQRVFDERIRLTPGARRLVMTMRANGAMTALVSGGFTYFTERVASAAGFQHHQANQLHFVDGKLDGGVVEPILGPAEKLAALEDLSAEHRIAPIETMAIGDGANDMAMVEAAGLGIAFHAKPVLAAAADACIEHGDLTAALYFQGYRAAEFRQ